MSYYALWVEANNGFSFSDKNNGGMVITDDTYNELFVGQSSGKVITKDANGLPALSDGYVQTLDDVKAIKIIQLSQDCSNAILSGFSSSALGSAYTYGSQLTDQANLVQTANTVSGGDLWCENTSNVWAFVTHTQAQAQTVLADFVAFRNKQQQQLVTLTAQVNAATDTAAVEAIVWVSAP